MSLFQTAPDRKFWTLQKNLAIKKRKNPLNRHRSLYRKSFWSCVRSYLTIIIQLWFIQSQNEHMIMDILPLLHQHCETRAPNNIIWILWKMIWILLESFICIQLLFFQKLMICQNRFPSSISGIKMTRLLLTRSMSAAPNLPDSSQNIWSPLDTARSLIYQHRSVILNVPDQNVTMHLLQPSKNTLEMTASVFVLSHPESIICCLQICWNILPDTIWQNRFSKRERILLPSLDTMIWLHLES